MKRGGKIEQRLARRRRRGQRGAAMVESLVAIPFFVVVFVCAIFMGKLYREKLKTIREAKQCVWQSAMVNCEGGCSKAQVKDDGDPDLDQGAENNPSQGAPGTAILTRGFKMATLTVTGEAVEKYEVFGMGSVTETPATFESAMCNEKPENGDLRGVFLFTYHKLTPW